MLTWPIKVFPHILCPNKMPACSFNINARFWSLKSVIKRFTVIEASVTFHLFGSFKMTGTLVFQKAKSKIVSYVLNTGFLFRAEVFKLTGIGD